MDFGKIAKTILTATGVTLGVIAAAWASNPKNVSSAFSINFNDDFDDDFDFNDRDQSKEILNADELRQLRWMSVDQLRALFKGRQGTFRIEKSPDAYRQLRWMSTEQLKAIFGSKDI